MKKDKNWLKEEVSELYPSYDEMYVSPDYETVAKTETVSKVLELIDQLDEPEKVVIPQFVAKWIESYRKKTLVELINDAVYSSDEDSKCFRRWFHEEMGFESSYSEFISRAWLDGYEVEMAR